MTALPFLARHWKLIGIGLIVAVLLAYGLRNDHLRAGYKAALATMQKQADTVVVALRTATDNPKADWQTAPGQIVALGESNRMLKGEITATNQRIDEMAEEAVRLRARADQLQAIAAKAEAQRRAAYSKLSDMAITPGERSDCMALLAEAEDALNTVREAGL